MVWFFLSACNLRCVGRVNRKFCFTGVINVLQGSVV